MTAVEAPDVEAKDPDFEAKDPAMQQTMIRTAGRAGVSG